jgi:hypothetical protein
MAVNWDLAPKISGSDYLGPLHAMELGRQATTQRLQAEAQKQALKQAQSGDYAGAQQTAIGSGDFDLAQHLASVDDSHRKAMADSYDTIARVAYGLKALPPEQRQAAFDQHAGLLAAHHVPAEMIATARGRLDDASLDSYAADAMSVLDQIKRHDALTKPIDMGPGHALIDPVTKEVLASTPKEADWQFDPQSGSWLQKPGTGTGPPGIPTPQGAPTSAAALLPAVIAQESGGVPRPGPETQYGRAQGITQMLPQTAQGVAQSLGIPFREDLLTGNSPEALAYQSRLGQAYLQQGLDKYGGDPRKALMYYHGGPDESLWGPKTHAYADAVLARTGAPATAQPHPGVINVRPGKVKDAPVGYRFQADGETLAPIAGGPADPAGNPKQMRQSEVQYRKEFDNLPEVKNFKIMRTAKQQVQALATKPNPSATDDVAMIFSYMKMLDPNSVVREGEYATAQNATGIPEQWMNLYNRALQGNRLNPSQRKNMLATVDSVYVPQREVYNQAAERYRGYARDSGVNPDNVARTYTPDGGKRTPPHPAVGTVKGGYTYKGGDPALPSSWAKQ